ncbi:MAG: DegT/DnrJ/EryC1/StrS family aminotransferase [Thaumarchaeota archaeon]|jgi:perosamine synthetase|nr:DegT/DnrJ/EryC1/StrS family aminotransferase [Nitrososphaerota archaeon]MBT6171725.1 DegT/DnrJ/EryC1/StrS family aminotransferase [Nitrososphaerota archaeon]MBT6370338.1 DegT/DnrJ/EryC1/StrS family aminotransferase [Nitrososphaerota archaeon]
MKIPFFVQEFTDEMEEAAIHALRNESFVGGESVSKFEEEFAQYTGTKYAASVSSGNGALQISLMALEIGESHEVITPTNSFIASANCIRMTNAKPILTDIDMNDGGINLSNIKKNVNAIIPVHIYGNPCNFDSVKSFAEEQKIPIIEDACQAHGAEYKGKKVGSLGDVGCFSFYPTKNMTVGGDGGMTTTDNEETILKIKSIRDNGRKTKNEFDKLGFTMRLNTVNAAIGRVQLKHLNEKTARRREIVSIYRKNLVQDCILPENKDGKSVYHQIVVKHEKRDEIRKELTDNEIGSAIYYETPIHKQPIYEIYKFELPNSEKFSKLILSLPSYPQLTNDQALEICEHVNKVIG